MALTRLCALKCGYFKIILKCGLFQPNNTRWITPIERRLAQARLSEDAGEADKDNAEDSYVHKKTCCQIAHREIQTNGRVENGNQRSHSASLFINDNFSTPRLKLCAILPNVGPNVRVMAKQLTI